MSPSYGEAYQRLWQRGLDFAGRSGRASYWKVVLINVVIAVLFLLLDNEVSRTFVLVQDLYFLLVLVPDVALTMRRLHDTNRSGWWWLIGFIPVVGALYLIWLVAQPSDAGGNRFGPPETAPGGLLPSA